MGILVWILVCDSLNHGALFVVAVTYVAVAG